MKLAEKVASQKNIAIDFRAIEAADHFYTGQMEDLIGHVEDYVDKFMAAAAA